MELRVGCGEGKHLGLVDGLKGYFGIVGWILE